MEVLLGIKSALILALLAGAVLFYLYGRDRRRIQRLAEAARFRTRFSLIRGHTALGNGGRIRVWVSRGTIPGKIGSSLALRVEPPDPRPFPFVVVNHRSRVTGRPFENTLGPPRGLRRLEFPALPQDVRIYCRSGDRSQCRRRLAGCRTRLLAFHTAVSAVRGVYRLGEGRLDAALDLDSAPERVVRIADEARRLFGCLLGLETKDPV